MKLSIFQLIIGLFFLVLAIYSSIKGEAERFHSDLILANIWIVASQITRKLED